MKEIFAPYLEIHPCRSLSKTDFRRALPPLFLIGFVSFFFSFLMLPTMLAWGLLVSRRLADLCGEEFYAGPRAPVSWLLAFGILSIPFLGLFVGLWVLCLWDRPRLRDELRRCFEAAELV